MRVARHFYAVAPFSPLSRSERAALQCRGSSAPVAAYFALFSPEDPRLFYNGKLADFFKARVNLSGRGFVDSASAGK